MDFICMKLVGTVL